MILDCKISSGFFYALPDQKSSTYEMIHKTDIFTILFYFILGSGPEIKYSFNIVEIDVGDGRVQGNKTKKKPNTSFYCVFLMCTQINEQAF